MSCNGAGRIRTYEPFGTDLQAASFNLLHTTPIYKLSFFIERMKVIGFEPTQPEGNSFTDCCDSPTSPHFHSKDVTGFEPATNRFAVCRV